MYNILIVTIWDDAQTTMMCDDAQCDNLRCAKAATMCDNDVRRAQVVMIYYVLKLPRGATMKGCPCDFEIV